MALASAPLDSFLFKGGTRETRPHATLNLCQCLLSVLCPLFVAWAAKGSPNIGRVALALQTPHRVRTNGVCEDVGFVHGAAPEHQRMWLDDFAVPPQRPTRHRQEVVELGPQHTTATSGASDERVIDIRESVIGLLCQLLQPFVHALALGWGRRPSRYRTVAVGFHTGFERSR